MSPGKRVARGQIAERINAAVDLLETGLSRPQAIRRLATDLGVSERQARRYLEQAQGQGPVEVPGPKQVFTVKVPSSLVDRLRAYARTSGRTLSSLVTQAVEEFLGKPRAGPRGGRSAG